jgi:hypothetical protein
MTGSRNGRAAAVAIGAAILTLGTGAQRPIEVACTPSTPIVAAPATIRVRAWSDAPETSTITFRWAATAGRVAGTGPDVEWTIAAAEGGTRPPYRATVRADSADGGSGTCTVEVWPTTTGRGPAPVPPPGPAPGPAVPPREAGRGLLVSGTQARDGYGLYSYLVLGASPTDATRDRYLQTIAALWSLAPDLTQLERYLLPRQLNAMLVPVVTPGSGAASPQWVLDNYDYARARVLLRAVGRTGRDGPYLISSLQPLDSATATGPHLFQDLSSIPPTLATAWTREFLNQAAQQRFWEERTGAVLGLKMRTTIRVLAMGLPDVQRSLGEWIRWSASAGSDR